MYALEILLVPPPPLPGFVNSGYAAAAVMRPGLGLQAPSAQASEHEEEVLEEAPSGESNGRAWQEFVRRHQACRGLTQRAERCSWRAAA